MESVIQNGEKRYFLTMPTRSFNECTLANCNCFRIESQHSPNQTLTCANITPSETEAVTTHLVAIEEGSNSIRDTYFPHPDRMSEVMEDSGADGPRRSDLRECDLRHRKRNQMEESIAPYEVFKYPEVIDRLTIRDQIDRINSRQHRHKEPAGSTLKVDERRLKRTIARDSKGAEKIARYVEKLYFKKEVDVTSNSYECDSAENAEIETSDEELSGSIEVEVFLKEDAVAQQQELRQEQRCEEELYNCLICDLLYQNYEDVQSHVVDHLYMFKRLRYLERKHSSN